MALLAGEDTRTTYQQTKQVFAGITLKVSESVSGAVEQLRQAPSTFTSGQGGAGYEVLGMASGTLQAVDGLLKLSKPHVGVGVFVGANGSRSQAGSVTSIAVGTTINAGSLTIEGGNVRLQGVQANVKGDVVLDARAKLTVESAQSVTRSTSANGSWNASVGYEWTVVGASPGGFTASGGVSQGSSEALSVTNLNSVITSGGTLTMRSGGDMLVAGADIRAKNATIEAKGNFTLESRQDIDRGSGSTSQASVTLGLSTPSASVSVGGSRSVQDRAWVGDRTQIVIAERLDATVGGAAVFNGARCQEHLAGTGDLLLGPDRLQPSRPVVPARLC